MTQTKTKAIDAALAVEAIISLEAEITKQQISQYREHKLCLNNQAFRGIEARTLQFLGFFGAYCLQAKRYRGEYRFLRVAEARSGKIQSPGEADFNLLPGISQEGSTADSQYQEESLEVAEEAPADDVPVEAEAESSRKRTRKRPVEVSE